MQRLGTKAVHSGERHGRPRVSGATCGGMGVGKCCWVGLWLGFTGLEGIAATNMPLLLCT